MNFSTVYLTTGIATLIVGLIVSINGYNITGSLLIMVIMLLGSGILLWFFESIIKAKQKQIPSYEEVLVIYNKMIESDKQKKKRRQKSTKKSYKKAYNKAFG